MSKKPSIKNTIRSLTPEKIKTMSTEDLLKEAKKAQKFVNDRLRRLDEQGLKMPATTMGAREKSLKNIKTRKSAIASVQQARNVLFNPLSTPGKYKKAIKAAEKKYNTKASGLKASLSKTGQPEIIPKKQDGQDFTKRTIKAFGDYWKWVEKNGVDSEEAVEMYVEAIDAGEDPIDYAERKIAEQEEETNRAEQEAINKAFIYRSEDL